MSKSFSKSCVVVEQEHFEYEEPFEYEIVGVCEHCDLQSRLEYDGWLFFSLKSARKQAEKIMQKEADENHDATIDIVEKRVCYRYEIK